MLLSDCARGRDNNFNLLRLAAALAVLVSHSFSLSGASDREPLARLIGISLGQLAVDVFFITSGFLITSSLLNRARLVDFAVARILQIFPALWGVLVLTVFALGPAMTRLPLPDYLTSPKTSEYFIKTATLFYGVGWNLPGVFETNPFKDAANGSLWTLPTELKMYLYFASTWLVLSIFPSSFRTVTFKFIVTIFSIVYLIVLMKFKFVGGNMRPWLEWVYFFLQGASFYVWRDKIFVSRLLFLTIAAILVASTFDHRAFVVCYFVLLAPLVLNFAYAFDGSIRAINGIGDYSYGVYIFAFAVQQTLISLWPTLTVAQMVVLSATITSVLAVLSWHLIEKRALAQKENFAAAIFGMQRQGRVQFGRFWRFAIRS